MCVCVFVCACAGVCEKKCCHSPWDLISDSSKADSPHYSRLAELFPTPAFLESQKFFSRSANRPRVNSQPVARDANDGRPPARARHTGQCPGERRERETKHRHTLCNQQKGSVSSLDPKKCNEISTVPFIILLLLGVPRHCRSYR